MQNYYYNGNADCQKINKIQSNTYCNKTVLSEASRFQIFFIVIPRESSSDNEVVCFVGVTYINIFDFNVLFKYTYIMMQLEK